MARELDKLAEERFADDPELLKGYRNTRAIEIREKRQKALEADLERRNIELDGLAWAIQMHKVADEVQAERQVPRSVLEACTSEEQMRKIAEAFPEVGKEGATEQPKFDSGLSSGAGVNLEGMSPRELIQHGLNRQQKKK